MFQRLCQFSRRVVLFQTVLRTKDISKLGCDFQRELVVLQIRSYGQQKNAIVQRAPNTISKTSDFDVEEYIVPYRSELEKTLNKSILLEVLREKFRLTSADVKQILNDEIVCQAQKNRSILLGNLDTLALEGVNKRSIIDNSWLLILEHSRLLANIALIKTMEVRDINYFVPFLRLSTPRIRKLVTALNKESSMIPFGNRIYYISEKLNVNPTIVSRYLSKRLFVLQMPFGALEENLGNMIRYNVSALDVLKDLWAFRYTPKSVELRLERAKRAKKNKIMPWMVRCPEPILQRSFQLTLDELKVLNGKNSVLEYIAERLKFGLDETRAIICKHPQVNRVRVTKIKQVLDYLLDEEGFSRYEVAQVPRILCHSLNTTKKRLRELKKINCRPSSLVIVCRSRREFEKFTMAWKSIEAKKTLSVC